MRGVLALTQRSLRAAFRARASTSSSLYTAGGTTRTALVRRKATAAAPAGRPLRVCVVGSGPAGFYVTKYLLKVSDKARRKSKYKCCHVCNTYVCMYGIHCSPALLYAVYATRVDCSLTYNRLEAFCSTYPGRTTWVSFTSASPTRATRTLPRGCIMIPECKLPRPSRRSVRRLCSSSSKCNRSGCNLQRGVYSLATPRLNNRLLAVSVRSRTLLLARSRAMKLPHVHCVRLDLFVFPCAIRRRSWVAKSSLTLSTGCRRPLDW